MNEVSVVDHETGEILSHNENPARYWAESVKAEWRKTVAGVIETGKLITEAIGQLEHGEKEAFYSMLPFSQATASKLTRIAETPRLANHSHVNILPSSWGTLYELTRLDDGAWQYALDNGLIRPEMERKDVRKILSPGSRVKQEPIPPPAGTFSLIYADPPWRYEHVKTESRAIENQYPTMDLDEICGLPIGEIAHDDCVLFMWTTSPKLYESMRVLDAWGFTYRTCAVWDKQKIGMGYYFRQQHELLLVAAKGSPSVPEASNRVSSVISSPREQHSRKPDLIYDLIESMYPDATKIELFCRRPRDGWSAWGNEVA